jgi:hypothetical protein
VPAFEELVGSHGGLGGTQAQPFVLHPSDLTFPEERVVGAETLHRTIKPWAQEAMREETGAPPSRSVEQDEAVAAGT